MYIPVDEETEGGTPILNSKGLKMTPPPRPSAPDTQPPINAKKTNLNILEPSNLISPSTSPDPYLIFNYCSLLTCLIDVIVIKQQMIINPNCNDQSNILHL